MFFEEVNHVYFLLNGRCPKSDAQRTGLAEVRELVFRPYFGKPPVVRSPFPLSVSRVLHFNCVNLKTVTQAEQEGKLFGRLASVLWVLCACQCACLAALAIRDFAYLPQFIMVLLSAWCVLQMCQAFSVC
jgi:hypothetical protein